MIPYIISSFRGGLSDENDKGIAGAYKFGSGLDIHGRDDILTGKQSMATILGNTAGVFGTGYPATTHTGIIKFFVPASDGTTYCFGSTGSVFSRSGDGTWNFVYNDENGNIKGAAEWKLDTEVDYLFWATNTSIARKALAGVDVAPDTGTARWTDVTADWKTLLDPADYHTMRPASGQLMIANGNYLASVDYSGSFLPAALNIRPGNLIKTLEERDDYVILGSYRKDNSEEGHIWSWIISATNWIQKKRIPVKGVNSMISTELLLLQGGDEGELFFSDFVNAVPLHGIPGGGQTTPAGVSIENDIAVFGIYGGTYPGIWSYGRKRKNRPMALNYDYRLAQTVAGSSISTIAAVCMVDGTLLTSWGTTDGSTSEYGVDSASSTTKATAVYEGLEFSGGRPYWKKNFNTVVLNMTPLPAGCSLSVRFKMDKETVWRYAVTGGNATVFSEADQTEAIFSIVKPGNVYEVGIDLNPSVNDSPQILAVSSYLDETGYEYA